MISISQFIDLTLQRGIPTKVSIPIKSEKAYPTTMTVTATCGCSQVPPKVLIEPFDTYLMEVTVTRSSPGQVNVNFTDDENNQLYKTVLNINVNN